MYMMYIMYIIIPAKFIVKIFPSAQILIYVIIIWSGGKLYTTNTTYYILLLTLYLKINLTHKCIFESKLFEVGRY